MKDFLIIVSGLLTLGSSLPYIIEIIRGKTKPRIVSWLTWTILTAIACAASFADRQYPAAILMFCAVIETALVVVLGFKHGDRSFERLDIVCQLGALIGLALWFTLKSPMLAVLVTVAIDFTGAIPTLWHSWKSPHEETWAAYALAGLGGGLTVLAAGHWQVTAVLYPLYILVINAVLTGIILGSPHRRTTQAPPELREL